jgi:hypothetical protein
MSNISILHAQLDGLRFWLKDGRVNRFAHIAYEAAQTLEKQASEIALLKIQVTRLQERAENND